MVLSVQINKSKIVKREDKVALKIERSIKRRLKKKKKNSERRPTDSGLDCPFDVDMNGKYGTCHCNHENYESCLDDI